MFRLISNYLRTTKLFNPLRLHKHEGYKAMKPYLKANGRDIDMDKLVADLQRRLPAVKSSESRSSAETLSKRSERIKQRATKQIADSSNAVKKVAVNNSSDFIYQLTTTISEKCGCEYSYNYTDRECSHNERLLTIYADGKSQFVLCYGGLVIFEQIVNLLNGLIEYGYKKIDVYYYTYHLVIEKSPESNIAIEYKASEQTADNFEVTKNIVSDPMFGLRNSLRAIPNNLYGKSPCNNESIEGMANHDADYNYLALLVKGLLITFGNQIAEYNIQDTNAGDNEDIFISIYKETSLTFVQYIGEALRHTHIVNLLSHLVLSDIRYITVIYFSKKLTSYLKND